MCGIAHGGARSTLARQESREIHFSSVRGTGRESCIHRRRGYKYMLQAKYNEMKYSPYDEWVAAAYRSTRQYSLNLARIFDVFKKFREPHPYDMRFIEMLFPDEHIYKERKTRHENNKSQTHRVHQTFHGLHAEVFHTYHSS